MACGSCATGHREPCQAGEPSSIKRTVLCATVCLPPYDQDKALAGADFVYAKNWSAYTDPNYGKVLSQDRSWTVTTEKMALTNNAYFMHCLPVRRNMIVSDDVIESERSIVIPEAANREISAQVVLKRILEGLQ